MSGVICRTAISPVWSSSSPSASPIPCPRPWRGEWDHLLAIEDLREKRTKLEEYLDRGVGECHLRDPRVAKLCEDALRFFHDERYELLAWCVMPNHVHVLVQVWEWPLWKMIVAWKKFVAPKALGMVRTERRSPTRHVPEPDINAPARRAALQTLRWQREYWDTFMRDEKQEKTAIRYIEANPVKAKLCRAAEDWAFTNAKFRDEYRRLVIPNGK